MTPVGTILCDPRSPIGITSMKASMSDNVVVFDVETQREFAEVGGREFAEQLGISVAVAYHTGERRFYTFEESELDGLFDLFRRASLLVGFNILQFDFGNSRSDSISSPAPIREVTISPKLWLHPYSTPS